MVKVWGVVCIIVSIILLVNIIAFGVSANGRTSFILKLKPINIVFVFAHGNYQYFDNGYVHATIIKGKTIPTSVLLDNLREEGYEYIWIGMCRQGNEEYVEKMGNFTIEWGDDVSRVKKPGDIYPIYLGLGFTRLVFD